MCYKFLMTQSIHTCAPCYHEYQWWWNMMKHDGTYDGKNDLSLWKLSIIRMKILNDIICNLNSTKLWKCIYVNLLFHIHLQKLVKRWSGWAWNFTWNCQVDYIIRPYTCSSKLVHIIIAIRINIATMKE
jgi:hypothetical protein